jgi:hypothetical protein
MPPMDEPSQNPFAPPEAGEPPAASAPTLGLWRDGSRIVASVQQLPPPGDDAGLLRVAAPLPDRCFVCNGPAVERLSEERTWHHPALYLLLLAGILPYFLARILIRRTLTISFAVCAAHLRTSVVAATASWALTLGGLAAVLAPPSDGPRLVPLAGLVGIAAGLLVGPLFGHRLRVIWLGDEHVWIGGAGAAFRDSLPERKE